MTVFLLYFENDLPTNTMSFPCGRLFQLIADKGLPLNYVLMASVAWTMFTPETVRRLWFPGRAAVYSGFLEMKHDLLQMEHTALVEPKGFWQGSTIIWEVKFRRCLCSSREGKAVEYLSGIYSYVGLNIRTMDVTTCIVGFGGWHDFKMRQYSLSLASLGTNNQYLSFVLPMWYLLGMLQ